MPSPGPEPEWPTHCEYCGTELEVGAVDVVPNADSEHRQTAPATAGEGVAAGMRSQAADAAGVACWTVASAESEAGIRIHRIG
jgi:hypothetical protein